MAGQGDGASDKSEAGSEKLLSDIFGHEILEKVTFVGDYFDIFMK